MTNSLSGSEVPNTELDRRNSGLSSPSISDKHLRALYKKHFKCSTFHSKKYDDFLSFDFFKQVKITRALR